MIFFSLFCCSNIAHEIRYQQFCSRTIERKQKRDRLNSLRKNQTSTDEDSSNDEENKMNRPDLLENKNDDDKLFFNPNNDNPMVQKEFDFSEVYYFLTQGKNDFLI